MERRILDETRRWLAAEAAGDEATARAAFGAAFARLPRLAPRPGFAERVAWAAVPAPRTRPALAEWGWKVALATSMALAGLAAGMAPLLRLLPVRVGALGGALQVANDAFSWLAGRTAEAFAALETLGRVGRALAVAASTPEAATALFASAAIGGLALYTLDHLLTPERRPIR